ncbi:hypothetical protein D3C80_2094990 [compost metagenome]
MLEIHPTDGLVAEIITQFDRDIFAPFKDRQQINRHLINKIHLTGHDGVHGCL